MTDRYERIREALAMGPTPGPWHAAKPEPHGTEVRGHARVSLAWCGCATTVGEGGCYSIRAAEAAANAALIAACDPDTIRELLAERDALAAAIEAAQAERDAMREALEDIRSRMRLDPFDRLAELDNIHQIADAALSAADRADGRCR